MPRSITSQSRIVVYKNVLLDGRLALFHQRQKWLAVADLHFGYELSQRAAGNLFPLWGMQSIDARLSALMADYNPKRLILLGDLIHDSAGAKSFYELVRRMQKHCELVLICGNHDRQIKQRQPGRRLAVGSSDETSKINPPAVDHWQSGGFYFHHGDRLPQRNDAIEIIGHHHPAGSVRDGAGLRLKLPAFVQRKNCWIMPAFSPWAAGSAWPDMNGDSKIWLCSPQRVFAMDRDL